MLLIYEVHSYLDVKFVPFHTKKTYQKAEQITYLEDPSMETSSTNFITAIYWRLEVSPLMMSLFQASLRQNA